MPYCIHSILGTPTVDLWQSISVIFEKNLKQVPYCIFRAVLNDEKGKMPIKTGITTVLFDLVAGTKNAVLKHK